MSQIGDDVTSSNNKHHHTRAGERLQQVFCKENAPASKLLKPGRK